MSNETTLWPNLVSMFFVQAGKLGDKPFLWAKRNGAYEPLTWRQAADQVVKLAHGLRALGIGAGDRVVLVSENRPEWLIADVAIMATGAITVPAYTTNTEADHLHILEDSGAKGAIVSTRRFANQLLPAAHRSTDMQFVIAMDPLEIHQHLSIDLHAWSDVLADGGRDGKESDIVATADGLKRDGTACIIYTSGTGGGAQGRDAAPWRASA